MTRFIINFNRDRIHHHHPFIIFSHAQTDATYSVFMFKNSYSNLFIYYFPLRNSCILLILNNNKREIRKIHIPKKRKASWGNTSRIPQNFRSKQFIIIYTIRRLGPKTIYPAPVFIQTLISRNNRSIKVTHVIINNSFIIHDKITGISRCKLLINQDHRSLSFKRQINTTIFNSIYCQTRV